MMRSRYLLALLTLAACGGDSADANLSGTYTLTGTGQGVTAPWTVNIVSQNEDRIILDFTGGPVLGVVPVRDTALWNVSAYRLEWRPPTNDRNYIVRITGTSCTGQTFFGFGNSPAWTACTLTR